MKIGVSSYSFQGLISEGKETQLSIIKTAKEMLIIGSYFPDSIKGISEHQPLVIKAGLMTGDIPVTGKIPFP